MVLSSCEESYDKVPLIMYNDNDPYILEFKQHIFNEALGKIKIDDYDSQNSQLLQNEYIDEVLKKDPNIMIINPVDRLAAFSMIEKIRKYDIPIIEDAASALGSKINKQKCGTFGDFGIISFNGNKIITTSGGGALICNSLETKDKAVFLATQARDQAPHYEHSHIGYNYRMSNVLAGIGRGQMEVLDERVAARRKIYEIYKNELSHTGFQFLPEPEGFYSNRWLSCILTQSFEIREKIRLSLEAENIESRPLWKPMHLQPVFQHQPKYENGVSANLFERGLCLPSGSNNSENDIQRVINVLKEF